MRAFSTIALLLGTLATAGCGGSKKDESGYVIVKGRLTDGGKAFALDENALKLPKGTHGLPPGVAGENSALSVVFYSTEHKASFSAKTNPMAGTFEVHGDTGKGIPPGRYKIAVTAKLGMSPDTPDHFGGKYTFDKTKILRDVKAGDEVVIDISKADG